jgi:hypothetical protein
MAKTQMLVTTNTTTTINTSASPVSPTQSDATGCYPHTIFTIFTNKSVIISHPVLGSANKSTGAKGTKTSQMLAFMASCYQRGDKDNGGAKANAFNPDTALAAMKVAGTHAGHEKYPNDTFMEPTESGFPRFALPQLLDRFQIRSYFGKNYAYLKGQAVSLAKKETRRAQQQALKAQKQAAKLARMQPAPRSARGRAQATKPVQRQSRTVGRAQLPQHATQQTQESNRAYLPSTSSSSSSSDDDDEEESESDSDSNSDSDSDSSSSTHMNTQTNNDTSNYKPINTPCSSTAIPAAKPTKPVRYKKLR